LAMEREGGCVLVRDCTEACMEALAAS
jgi:hypothetical protein